MAFRLATWAGTLLVLFAGWSLWGTGLVSARAQDQLTESFERTLAADAGASVRRPPELPTQADADVPPEEQVPGEHVRVAPSYRELDEAAPVPPAGTAVALLKIPRIGIEQAVVEGVTFRALAKGPGHYPGTAMPGEPGNVAIAGHRTTYGAPFFHVDKLRRGDLVIMTTRAGTFRYRVTSVATVRPDAHGVLRNQGDDRLTLTTCHPLYRASERLVVTAHPEGSAPAEEAVLPPPPEPVSLLDPELVPDFGRFSAPVPAAIETLPEVDEVAPVAGAASPDEGAGSLVGADGEGPDGEGAAPLLPAVGWSLVTAAIWAVMLRLGRRWPWTSRLAGAPVLLASLAATFDAAAPFLPTTF